MGENSSISLGLQECDSKRLRLFLKYRPIFYSVECLREVGEDELTAFARVLREEGVAVQLYRSPVKVLLASLVVLN